MSTVSDQRSSESAPADPALDGAGDRSTHFIFSSRVFNLPGGFFAVAKDTGDPVFHVHLGDVWGKIPIRKLKESFEIDEASGDGNLLLIVEKGLKYVREIRPGDSIPRELLDGSASWRVEERHLQIAKGRLTHQLVCWISGQDQAVVDRNQLAAILEDPEIRQRAQEAFAALATQFGLPEERKDEVVTKVDQLARELSYIEALRDRQGQVQQIFVKLAQIGRIYKGDRQFQSDLSRMNVLAKQPLANFNYLFSRIDAQAKDVMAMLKNFADEVAFIRRTRDDLHTSLMLWDEMIEAWQEQDTDRGAEMEFLVKRTYQFLAQHFLVSKVWQREA